MRAEPPSAARDPQLWGLPKQPAKEALGTALQTDLTHGLLPVPMFVSVWQQSCGLFCPTSRCGEPDSHQVSSALVATWRLDPEQALRPAGHTLGWMLTEDTKGVWSVDRSFKKIKQVWLHSLWISYTGREITAFFCCTDGHSVSATREKSHRCPYSGASLPLPSRDHSGTSK